MTITTAQLDADLDEMIADLPTSLTISGLVTGTAVNCVATDLNRGSGAEMAGLMAEDGVSFVVPTAAFTTRPVKGNKCTAGGVQYRVKNVITHADDVAITLECEEDE